MEVEDPDKVQQRVVSKDFDVPEQQVHHKRRRSSKSGMDKETQRQLFTSTYHFSPPPDDKMIAVKVRPQMFGVLAFVFPLAVGVVCFCLYVMEGRCSGYFPTISETGTEYPNTAFFAQMMSTGSMTTLLTLYVYSCYIQMVYKPSNKFIRWLDVFMFFAVFGITGLGFSPINEVHTRHLFFAGTGFIAILIFEVMCFTIEDKRKFAAKVRGVSIAIAITGLVFFGFASDLFDDRINVTISTIGEWALLGTMMFVFLTWGSELNTVEIYVAILE